MAMAKHSLDINLQELRGKLTERAATAMMVR
jgi:hypothetical protein